MKVTLEISDHLIEAMKKRTGVSTARILKRGAELLLELDPNYDDEVYAAVELLEIEPLVNQLYSGLRSAVFFPETNKAGD